MEGFVQRHSVMRRRLARNRSERSKIIINIEERKERKRQRNSRERI